MMHHLNSLGWHRSLNATIVIGSSEAVRPYSSIEITTPYITFFSECILNAIDPNEGLGTSLAWREGWKKNP